MSAPAPRSAQPYVDPLWTAAVQVDEDGAREVVLAALDDGLPAEDALLDLIGGVQRRVGVEWAANRITVAQEHAITAINDRAIAALAQHVSYPPADRGRITVACVDGEWHALPARLLAEVLRLRGFRVDYLGAQVPTPHLTMHLHRTNPIAAALSGSIATRLPGAHATIVACQAAGVPVLTGGAAFGARGDYARLLGADAWAPDARTAADLLGHGPPRRPAGARQRSADLPHLADQEYTMVSRARSRLVAHVLQVLPERVPQLRAYTEQQWQHTTEDIAHIVDFLATALYVDDPALFTAFLGWTADILAARDVPAAALLPALDALGEELREFPRALAAVHRGTATVRGLLEPVPEQRV